MSNPEITNHIIGSLQSQRNLFNYNYHNRIDSEVCDCTHSGSVAVVVSMLVKAKIFEIACTSTFNRNAILLTTITIIELIVKYADCTHSGSVAVVAFMLAEAKIFETVCTSTLCKNIISVSPITLTRSHKILKYHTLYYVAGQLRNWDSMRTN